ncbi:pentapeptide repeat-containing protein [Ruegeria atlantica]|uniref:pentapeptide repeat-containing protein n=1 Tax=Ruegeria atlantica TaxID=81569 RepID=UPI00249480F9|nr:pentapeptide repeat-containing protein [Ruegeria atlantica]
MPESLLSFSEVLIYGRELEDLEYKRIPSGGKGANKHLDEQFGVENGEKELNGPRFAKIYGFAFEGTYYDLPEPVIFLVHGKGGLVADPNEPPDNASRAPKEPGIGGVAAADYQVADGIRFWKYDKSDQTMRMDVMTGQFEQVLLDIYFGFDSPAISGAKVSGAKVSGAKVSGAKVSGAKVSGAKVSGAKVRGGD